MNLESGLGAEGTVYYKASWLDTATFYVSPVCFGNVDDGRKSFSNFEDTTFVGAVILRKLSSKRSRKLISASPVYSCEYEKVVALASICFEGVVWWNASCSLVFSF